MPVTRVTPRRMGDAPQPWEAAACPLPFAPCDYSHLVRGLKLQRLLGLCPQKAGVLPGETLHPCAGGGSAALP